MIVLGLRDGNAIRREGGEGGLIFALYSPEITLLVGGKTLLNGLTVNTPKYVYVLFLFDKIHRTDLVPS